MPLLCMIETINIGYTIGHTYSSHGTKTEQVLSELWGSLASRPKWTRLALAFQSLSPR